jgi:DNA-directed RNA polymerase subunit M/transcription elongation factor TFIIS
MFQFQCPQCANILQAEPAQAGQPSQCPICQTPFLIPAPVAYAGPAPANYFPSTPAPGGPVPTAAPPWPAASNTAWPPAGPSGGVVAGPGVGSTPAPQFPPIGPTARSNAPPFSGTPLPQKSAPVEIREPDVLHIPCPQCKQLLETPLEMLDQEVLCPYCQNQFRLKRRDSIESQRRRQQELELKERKAGNAWLNYAIVAVVMVLLFLLFLIFSSRPARAAQGPRADAAAVKACEPSENGAVELEQMQLATGHSGRAKL